MTRIYTVVIERDGKSVPWHGEVVALQIDIRSRTLRDLLDTVRSIVITEVERRLILGKRLPADIPPSSWQRKQSAKWPYVVRVRRIRVTV